MDIVITLSIYAALLYAAFVDTKKREIPDKVHIILLAVGVVKLVLAHISSELLAEAISQGLGLIIPFVIFITFGLVNDSSIGGGDIKLYSSLGFVVGIYSVLHIILCANILALLFSFLTRQKKQDHLPMSSFILLGALFFVRI